MSTPPTDTSLAAVDDVAEILLGGRRYLTGDEVAELAGLSEVEAEGLWQALGFPRLSTERAFTDGDVDALRRAGALLDAEIVDPALRLEHTRVLGRTMATLADAQIAIVAEAASRGVVADPAEMVETMEALQNYIWRRHLLAATERLGARPEAGSSPVAVGFTDLVSYTARSRELSAADLGAWLDEFERHAQAEVVEGGGRIVKTLGDEVMWVVDEPVAATRIALALAGPEVRTGVAYGPTLARAGDHYGPTVNLAARLTGLARPGTVLVDRALADVLEHGGRFRLRTLRPISVRGYEHLRATVVSAASDG